MFVRRLYYRTMPTVLTRTFWGRLLTAAVGLLAVIEAGVCAAQTTATAPDVTSKPATLHSAADLLVEGYYEKAIQQYQALLKSGEHAAAAASGLAECYLQIGRYADVREIPADLTGKSSQQARYTMLQAQAAAHLGQYERAIDLARTAKDGDTRLARARLILAQSLEKVGRTDDALSEYQWFDRVVAARLPEDAESLTAVGVGFYRYSVLVRHPGLSNRTRHVLNEILQEAYTTVDRSYWPARVAAGDLLREKFNHEQAEEDYKAALGINHHAADAQVGLGLLALENWDFETIERRGEAALEINPSHTGAHRLLAAGRIVERRYDDAIKHAQDALAVNPNDVEALAWCAAAHLAKYDEAGANELIARAEAINPNSAALHRILGDVLGGLRQFPESERHYLAAIEFEPSNASARTELGLMYMQWGYEAKAREALEGAWKIDEFNARTKNTLELLERLESFDAIETEHFIVHYDKETDELIAQLFAPYLESIYHRVCDDFNVELERKTIIEIFPAHSEFAVRITGKPWIHTVGACTGWVIAVDAPRVAADLNGPYNLANVLRHEFTHTVTLAATKNRIPHWFTEGLAVLQEDVPRSYDWKEMLAGRVRKNDLFTLQTIDWGFIRPRRANDRQFAYAQSEWMCEYLIETYGYDVIDRMLKGFKAARSQPQVFTEIVGVLPEDFDLAFAAWARAQTGAWGFDMSEPRDVYRTRIWAAVKTDDASAQAVLAKAEYDAENWTKALDAARKSVELDNQQNVEGLEILLRVLSELYASSRDPAERKEYEADILKRAQKLVEIDPDNRVGVKSLATIHVRREKHDDALPLLQTLRRVSPDDPFAPRVLAGIYLKHNDDDAALPELLEVARTEEHDAEIPQQIAAILARRDRLHDARFWYTQALYIHPLSEPVRLGLAELLMRMGDTAAAADEYESLCRINPRNAEYPTRCALAWHKLGNADKAREFAQQAVNLDPTSPAKALLKAE